MRKFLIVSLGIILMIFLLAPWALIQYGRGKLHDLSIPQRDFLLAQSTSKKVLAIFPHPDDEVTVSGTILGLKELGHEVKLICLTRGEKGKSSGIEDEIQLARQRTLEMQNAAAILGVDSLILLDYPDSGLSGIGLDSLKKIVEQLISEIKPDVLLSYDSKVGLYGHSDHRLTGLAVQEVFLENKGTLDFTPSEMYQVTLCKNQIDVALQLSSGFQRNYPENPADGLPQPDFSVVTQPYFKTVLKVMKAYESQQKVLQDLMPFHDRIPSWIYSRIFDREYFAEVK